jgi:hypothetical protein
MTGGLHVVFISVPHTAGPATCTASPGVMHSGCLWMRKLTAAIHKVALRIVCTLRSGGAVRCCEQCVHCIVG